MTVIVMTTAILPVLPILASCVGIAVVGIVLDKHARKR